MSTLLSSRHNFHAVHVRVSATVCTQDCWSRRASLPLQAACHSLFLKRVRANLHCLLVATPWPAWQARTQRFPALLSATQQLWVGSWSAPSLQALAQQHLVQLRPELDAGTASKLAALCVDLHSAACRADERVSRAQGCRRGPTPSLLSPVRESAAWTRALVHVCMDGRLKQAVDVQWKLLARPIAS